MYLFRPYTYISPYYTIHTLHVLLAKLKIYLSRTRKTPAPNCILKYITLSYLNHIASHRRDKFKNSLTYRDEQLYRGVNNDRAQFFPYVPPNIAQNRISHIFAKYGTKNGQITNSYFNFMIMTVQKIN